MPGMVTTTEAGKQFTVPLETGSRWETGSLPLSCYAVDDLYVGPETIGVATPTRLLPSRNWQIMGLPGWPLG